MEGERDWEEEGRAEEEGTVEEVEEKRRGSSRSRRPAAALAPGARSAAKQSQLNYRLGSCLAGL